MHGRVQREGESSRSLRRSISQHMRSVPPLATSNRTIAASVDHSSVTSSTITTTSTTSDSFFKDGRKISIGDCALFKPPQDAPPFIGIIRWLAVSKEKKLRLGVNWLYRPAELKLGKGIQLDAAPNEIFYSFHKDEIPAASLLHPCKVSFLPKGVELPAGISSFICRRVYDIENNCLWWLNDQDYINERQEEVDQLLHKTRREMHVTMQSGGPSPKPINGPASTLQSKSGSDNGQIGATSFSPQVKGKKRERGDQGADPIKRELSSKTDDGDSGIYRAENSLKSEIVKITGKGGLMDLEGVEKFVQLMQPERMDRKMDLINRALLAGVLAATDKFDCLNQFVQLRGLPVLDEWLQDIHKGKINDGNSSKDGDKSVEEFLLVLLRALEKLPVNLHALKMCNIGKSVNHLRSHKNLEIQKKARSLVDTWKKRVEAEIDAKSGSTQAVSPWSSKSRLPESSQGGCKNSNGSDVAIKSSITLLSASKTSSVKSSHGENNTKSSSSSPGRIKSTSSPVTGKDIQPRISVGSASDVPLSREDKSSSSVQSHSYNQSLVKDDVKGSAAGLMSVNKISGSASRHRKSSNGFPGTPVTGGLKETSSSRSSSLHRNTALEKSSQPAFNSDKALEAPVSESSSHKLIVKIPNRGRVPSQGANVGSSEDPSIMSSRVSSPVHSEKNDQIDHNPKERSDADRPNFTSDVNMESWQSHESKDVMAGSDEAIGSPAALPHEEQSRTTEVSRRIVEASKRNDLKSCETSFSPMNALIESCVKYSEANSSVSLEDDIGMNLLASVAAGEMSRTDSPERSTPVVDELSTHEDGKSKSSPNQRIAGSQILCSDDGDSKNQVIAGTSMSEEGLHPSKHASLEYSGERRGASSQVIEDLLTGECNKHVNLRTTADPQGDISEKSCEMKRSVSLMPSGTMEKMKDGELSEKAIEEKVLSSNVNADAILDCKPCGNNNLVSQDIVSHVLSNVEGGKRAAEVVASCHSCDGDSKNDVKEELSTGFHLEQELPAVVASSAFTERCDNEMLQRTVSGKKVISENDNDVTVEKGDEKDSVNYVKQSERQNFDKGAGRSNVEDQGVSCLDTTMDDVKNQNIEANVENNEFPEHQSSIPPPQKESPAISSEEAPKKTELRESKLPVVEADETEECASSVAEASSAAAPPEPDAKIKFDLNEGFIADDGKYGEPVNFIASDLISVHVINPLLSAVNSVSSGFPASITVAAAAKGPFVPPEELLRSKSELGWKGSAATSAFRPAEPRKALELPLGLTNVSYSDAYTSRHIRPVLDIDLNVPDERVLEDMASRDSDLAVNSTSDFISNRGMTLNECIGAAPARGSVALDLDLNRVDEADEMGQCSSSSNFKVEGTDLPVDSAGGLPTGDVRMDFDLNDGPVDDASAEQFSSSHQGKGGMLSQLPTAGLRMNNVELGNFLSWFPPGNTYSNVTVPSMLPDRGDQPFPVAPPGVPQRIFAPTGGTPFAPDVYRGPVLSSSPAIPFPSSSFQYPVFPFGTTFPIPSATFSVGTTSYVDSSSGGRLFTAPVNSQFLGHVGAVSSQFPRPYLVSLPDGGGNGGLDNNRKWGRSGLDLNAGPGAIDMEGREEMLPLASRQLSVASSQALAEEQARILSVSGGILKRKEPEGGWDTESFRYKQSSWQ